jgi:hypothetical protein
MVWLTFWLLMAPQFNVETRGYNPALFVLPTCSDVRHLLSGRSSIRFQQLSHKLGAEIVMPGDIQEKKRGC